MIGKPDLFAPYGALKRLTASAKVRESSLYYYINGVKKCHPLSKKCDIYWDIL